MKTIAIYGGAFNPVHCGHAMVATWVYLTGQADEVWLAPSFSHPFGKEMAPYQTRLLMCRRLSESLGSWARPSNAEVCNPTGYTIDLLRYLRGNYGGSRDPYRFRFIMGSDNLALKAKWHGFDDILAEFNPIFVQRAGEASRDSLTSQSPVFPDVSSTEVRRRLRDGEPVGHLVPKSVLEVVQGAGLYGAT